MSRLTDRRIWKRKTRDTVAALPTFEFDEAPYRVVLNCQRPVEETISESIKCRKSPAIFKPINRIEEVTP
jgi:hypothetical protein